MKNYEHIVKYENILNEQLKTIKTANEMLDYMDSHQKDYHELLEYYYGDTRNQDLSDDEKHLIPDDIKRGVLSEDGIYNLSIDYRSTAIRMIEIALKMLKEE